MAISKFSKNRVVLSDNQLEALRCRILGLDFEEIGELLGCSTASASQYVRRGMANITRARKMEARLVEYR